MPYHAFKDVAMVHVGEFLSFSGPSLASIIGSGRWNWLGSFVLHPWKARSKMGIQRWSEDVILVDLPRGWEGNNELQTVIEMGHPKSDSNIVIDFSNVDIVGSTTFARLLELRQMLLDSGHKLVLCGLSPTTKGVFSIARLDSAFEFVEDRSAALASLQIVA